MTQPELKEENYVNNPLPGIPAFSVRNFQDEADYARIHHILEACLVADDLDEPVTLEDVRNTYTHLHHCDPHQDVFFADIAGETVGYSRVWWELEGSGLWLGFHVGGVLPEWRRKGIGHTLFQQDEQRLCAIARELKHTAQIPQDTECYSDAFNSEGQVARARLLERLGYQSIRCAFNMLRPSLEIIPDLPLPAGVEVRPVQVEQMRQIWEASNEAFKDHWGYIPDPWEEYQRIMNDPDFDPSLWRVAWQDDQVAGMVLSYIDRDENSTFGVKRGHTENICVRRPWRKQGLAKALIAMGLSALKERGMTEAALGVDAENISGALHLYQQMGFQVVKTNTIYRKRLPV